MATTRQLLLPLPDEDAEVRIVGSGIQLRDEEDAHSAAEYVTRVRFAAVLVPLVALSLSGAAAAVGIDFVTPSRNIGCVGDSTFVRCDISQTRVKPPPKPRSCAFDWGNAFQLRQRGRARRMCVSDSALGSRRILRYGRTQRFGRSITCWSRRTGLTCRNRDGHGFFLSRARIRLF